MTWHAQVFDLARAEHRPDKVLPALWENFKVDERPVPLQCCSNYSPATESGYKHALICKLRPVPHCWLQACESEGNKLAALMRSRLRILVAGELCKDMQACPELCEHLSFSVYSCRW
jgi:hypothetical protein